MSSLSFASPSTRYRHGLYAVLTVVASVAIWQLLSGRVISQYFIASPSQVWAVLREWMATDILLPALRTTIVGTLVAFAIGALVGVTLALVLTEYEFLDRVLEPMISIAFAVPYIVFAPLLVVALGIGPLPAIALACFVSFFMVFFQTYAGAKSVSPDLLNMATMLGASRWQRATRIKLPAALPFLAEGLRMGLIYAFHGEVVGEMMASNSGLGYQILFASTQLDAAGVLAGLVVLGLVAAALIGLLNLLESRLPQA